MSIFPDKIIESYILNLTLTGTKAASLAAILKNIDCADFTEMTVYAIWNPGTIGDTLNSVVEFSSNANLDFHPEPDEVVATGVATVLSKSRNYVALTTSDEAVPVISVPVADRRARISFSETAAGSAGVLTSVHVRLSRLK